MNLHLTLERGQVSHRNESEFYHRKESVVHLNDSRKQLSSTSLHLTVEKC